jgi:hypothetical protein
MIFTIEESIEGRYTVRAFEFPQGETLERLKNLTKNPSWRISTSKEQR